MYEEDDSGLRSSAVFAMGRSLNQRWYSTILNEFANDDAEVRYEAARAIGHFGDTSALPGLVTLAKDEDDEVRLAAIAAIGDIGGRAAQRVLQNLADQAGSDAEIDALDEALTEAALYDEDFSRCRTITNRNEVRCSRARPEPEFAMMCRALNRTATQKRQGAVD